MTHNQSLQVLLVENNPYDRAVLDACFEASPAAMLIYTRMSARDEAESVSPRDLWDLCGKRERAPDIVLLDLALTERCEKALASEEYRRFLRTQAHAFRDADFVLSDLDISVRPLMIESTLALLGYLQGLVECADLLEFVHHFIEGQDCLAEGLVEQKGYLGDGLVRVTEDSAASNEVLLDWWKDEGTLATVREMARAPSILRIFACVAAFPNRCFGVVSHYADEDTLTALHAILSYRYRSPLKSAQKEVLNKLVVNKADLFSAGDGVKLRGLVDRLRTARELWEARESPEAAVAPFAAMPVVTPKGEQVELWECIEKVWPRRYNPPLRSCLSGDGYVESCIVLWDETGLLVGREGSWHATSTERHLGWETILRKDFASPGCDVAAVEEFPESRPPGKPVCYVLHQKLEDSNDGKNLAHHIRLAFPGPPDLTILVVAGTSQARRAFEDGREMLEHEIALFRVPGWDDPIWEPKLPRLRERFAKIFARMSGFSSKSRQRQVIEKFVTELRLETDDQQVNEPMHRALSAQVGEEASLQTVSMIAGFIASGEGISERWIKFEDHALQIVQRIRKGEAPERVLEDLNLYERWRFSHD